MARANAATIDESVKVFASLFMWVLSVVAAFGCTAYGAWIILRLWAWFAIPQGVPAITFSAAIGLACIASFLVHNPLIKTSLDDKSDEPLAYRTFFAVGTHFAYDTMALLSAAIWHYWILR